MVISFRNFISFSSLSKVPSKHPLVWEWEPLWIRFHSSFNGSAKTGVDIIPFNTVKNGEAFNLALKTEMR